MPRGEFEEGYTSRIRNEISEMSQTYRDLFRVCSVRLEKLSSSALEANMIKGIGVAGKAVGKFIGKIPLVKDGQVDYILQDKGEKIICNALGTESKFVSIFASLSNPGTSMLIEKMHVMVKIYNHTSQIYFDKEKIYLMTN